MDNPTVPSHPIYYLQHMENRPMGLKHHPFFCDSCLTILPSRRIHVNRLVNAHNTFSFLQYHAAFVEQIINLARHCTVGKP